MATMTPPPKTQPLPIGGDRKEHNCPFYGRNIALTQNRPPLGLLLPTMGNQCALITWAFSPCKQEMEGGSVDWKACPVVASVRPLETEAPWPFRPAVPEGEGGPVQ